jgi:hypothetical protein
MIRKAGMTISSTLRCTSARDIVRLELMLNGSGGVPPKRAVKGRAQHSRYACVCVTGFQFFLYLGFSASARATPLPKPMVTLTRTRRLSALFSPLCSTEDSLSSHSSLTHNFRTEKYLQTLHNMSVARSGGLVTQEERAQGPATQQLSLGSFTLAQVLP